MRQFSQLIAEKSLMVPAKMAVLNTVSGGYGIHEDIETALLLV